MAVNRFDAERLFTRALARARVQYHLAQQAGQVLDYNVIARDMWDHTTHPVGSTYRDHQTAARRALRAVEAAHTLRANPNSVNYVADIPFNYGILSNQPRFQYRVVVNTTTGGRLDAGGQMFVFGSSTRLTHQEAVRRAVLMFERSPNWADYVNAVRGQRPTSNLSGVVIAVSQFEPN